MRFPAAINKVFNIKPGEEHIVMLLFSFSFLMGLAVVFYETAAYSLFLSRYEATDLPYIYIGAAVLIIICGSLYSYIESHFDFVRLMIGTLVMLGIGVVLLLIYRNLDPSDLSAAIIALWSDAIAMLVGFTFWSLSGRLLTLRQGKRLFSLVSTGEVIAGMTGGASIPLLLPSLGTANLLTVVVGAFVGCIMVFTLIASLYRETLLRSDLGVDESDDDEEDDEELRSGPQQQSEMLHWRSRYMILLSSLAAFSLIGYYFVDYLFYGLAEENYPTEEELASFLGIFFASVGAFNLVFKSLIAGRLLSRFGIMFGLLFLPSIILLGSIVAIAFGWFTQDMVVLFALLALIKLLDTVGRVSVDEPSTIILYQPLPVDFRLLAQARIESVGEPLASIIAGGILLLISALGVESPQHLLGFLTVVMIGWIITAVYVRKEYWITLANALSKRTLGSGIHLSLDQHSLEVLNSRLDSPHVGEVLYMLNLLEHENEQLLEDALAKLIHRPETEIQLDVLRRIERFNVSSLEPQVRRLIETSKNQKIRGAAIRTFSAIAEADIFEEVIPFLEHEDPQIRRNALVGLLRSGGIEGVLNAGEKYYAMLKSKDPRMRLLAAEVLGEVGIRNFYRPLLILFRDKYREVREAAYQAAGKLGNPRLWPQLVNALNNKLTRRTAEQSLAVGGPSAIPEITKAFISGKFSRSARIAMLRIISHYPPGEMSELSIFAASDDDPQIRIQALRALYSAKFVLDDNTERQQIRDLINSELDQATQLLVTMRDIERRSDYPLLVKDLQTKFEQLRARMFLLLGTLLGRKQGKQLAKNYFSDNRDKHAFALEMLSNLLEQVNLTIIFAIYDDISYTDALKSLLEHFPHNTGSAEYHLKEIILGNRHGITHWTQCVALYEIGKQRKANLYPTVKQAMLTTDNFVRETAIWAVAELNPITAPAVIETFMEDRAPNVRKIAKHICAAIPQ